MFGRCVCVALGCNNLFAARRDLAWYPVPVNRRLLLGQRGLPGMVVALVTGVVAYGCAQEEYPLSLYLAQHQSFDAGVQITTNTGTPAGPQYCTQARATPLPQRLVAMSASSSSGASAMSSGTSYTIDQLFGLFKTACGRCHVTASQGGFQATSDSSFTAQFNSTALNLVMTGQMPPPGDTGYNASFDSRLPTDPVYQFGTLAADWLAAGSPATFSVADVGAADGGSAAADGGAGADGGGAAPASFWMTPTVGNAMTDIGDCIPSPGLVATEQTRSAELDATFAAAQWNPSGTSGAAIIGLPPVLSQTDLITFDTAVLAQYGVIAYAPGYPLWSDDAGKLRYIRVPRGTSVVFNKETQQFTVPPNTRFYKTFQKQIIDTDGSIRYRKVETRLIVARPATPGLVGGSAQNALFGTYVWREDESDADLLGQTDSERDGLPWGDQVLQYNTDEQLAADLALEYPSSALETELLKNDAVRHYAIPSRERCIECHEGSANGDFVLGFLPLQINRRPVGEGGVIEPTGPDELTQLQRFIDYGLVTGMSSPSDVLPLENSEGSRIPRPSTGNYELVAQGYMLGNCSHCHNPNGAPSLQQPALVPLLNFLPGPDGGIFQFPLESYSPDTFRGPTSSTKVPFITPSLVDQPKSDSLVSGNGAFDAASDGIPAIYAPWRSFIYRNTDTAFTYGDDNALFPHMPRNTPGFDPRVHQILGDWMVSIPAVLKQPELAEYTFDTTSDDGTQDNWSNGPGDEDEQPYVEVPPGDPRYAAAVEAANQRLAIFHTGVNPELPSTSGAAYSRYSELSVTTDIIDPDTVANPICTPIPVAAVLSSGRTIPPPDHPDWVVTDTTQAPGYSPRRSDWESALIARVPETGSVAIGCPGGSGNVAAQTLTDEDEAIAALQNVRLDAQFRQFATTPVPFGLWNTKTPGCNYTSEPQATSFSGSSQPAWMAELTAEGKPPSGPVYSETPGAGVFKAICINCHGAIANSQGILALNLADMSGGLDIVADFRDGFMGPLGASSTATYRHQNFGPAATLANYPDAGVDGGPLPAPGPDWVAPTLTDDDNAARYMAWMALGGTKVSIPQPVLQIVQATTVLGTNRPAPPLVSSANMLSTAKALCASMFFGATGAIDPARGAYAWAGVLNKAAPAGGGEPFVNANLIITNGDAENWFKLCTYNPACPSGSTDCVPNTNQAPVRVVDAVSSGGDAPFRVSELNEIESVTATDANSPLLLDPSTYPPNFTVGDADGGTAVSLTTDNAWPWCVRGTAPAGYPACPPLVPTSAWSSASTGSARALTGTEVTAYAVRGAINAGLAAFTYVEGLELQSAPCPDYNQCPNSGDAGVGALCP